MFLFLTFLLRSDYEGRSVNGIVRIYLNVTVRDVNSFAYITSVVIVGVNVKALSFFGNYVLAFTGNSVPVVSCVRIVGVLIKRMLTVLSAYCAVTVVIGIVMKLSCTYGKLVSALGFNPVVSHIGVICSWDSGVSTELKQADFAPTVIVFVKVILLSGFGNRTSACGFMPVLVLVNGESTFKCVLAYLISTSVAETVGTSVSTGIIGVRYDF